MGKVSATSAFFVLFTLLTFLVPQRSMSARLSSCGTSDSTEIGIEDASGGISQEEFGDDPSSPTPSSIAPPRTSTDTLAIYDLQGRRITTPQRHTLYIYKGKKYVRR